MGRCDRPFNAWPRTGSRRLPPQTLLLLLLGSLLALPSTSPFLAVNAILSDYDSLVAAKGFSDAFLAPGNAEVAKSINSTLFSEDVVGTIDLSTTFTGRELLTEYFFGLLSDPTVLSQDDASATPLLGTGISFVGSPVGYEVASIMVENGVVSVSTKFDFYWSSLDAYYPQQIDAWITFNDQKQIVNLDATFRRWPWLTQILIPQLAPKMAGELGLNLNGTNEDYVVQQYFAHGVCNVHETHCKGSDQQYSDFNACLAFVASSIDLGYPWRMGENTTYCRALHMPMVPLRPDVHCPHLGPSGGEMCVPRDYRDVVAGVFETHTFIAPIPKTNESRYLTEGIVLKNGTPLSPLIALQMSGTTSWDPTWYPIGFVAYWFLLYVLASIIHAVCFRRASIYATLSTEFKKNVVQYVLNICITTIALGCQIVAARSFVGVYDLLGLQCLRVAGLLISGLYLFELTFRLKMRIPMIAHHILTVFAISLTVAMMEETQDPSFFISATIWLFQATTEQITFWALIGYRLDRNYRTVATQLRIASISTFLIKTLSSVGILVTWGLRQKTTYRGINVAYDVIVWVAGVGLLFTQIWGSFVTWKMGNRIEREGALPSTQASKTNLDLYRMAMLEGIKGDDRLSYTDFAPAGSDDKHFSLATTAVGTSARYSSELKGASRAEAQDEGMIPSPVDDPLWEPVKGHMSPDGAQTGSTPKEAIEPGSQGGAVDGNAYEGAAMAHAISPTSPATFHSYSSEDSVQGQAM